MTVASSVKQCLATIKDIESQLSTFSLNSLDEDAKRVFHETTLRMGDVKKDLQKRVLELERLEPQYQGS
ncbi:DUF1657 domain-containing protein [Neobacillus massiliamazoniensis]|uniref:DUF1657 domain-containing protein n=1 Tax=Neobacillus massiliamazoniensis TaxID=1499688 RepID=A0A0U1P060_9BACI|nr:DUF1657 domain-containing protein [Neobacillus massiliamazoniensis]CRK83679.1 Hypothetical protein BN000_03669 [Neobacillus massiliamazoniensis]